MEYANKMARNEHPARHMRVWQYHYKVRLAQLQREEPKKTSMMATLFSHF